jgi:hypothetical protein
VRSDICSAQMVRLALQESIEGYIDRHLLDGVVTPGVVAAAHWVSIHTVNRVFSATGHTVGEGRAGTQAGTCSGHTPHPDHLRVAALSRMSIIANPR